MGLGSTYRRCQFWQTKIIFSDKAHFDHGGHVNKRNRRIWGTENPHAYIEKPTHPKRVTVWCGIWSKDIIGPFSSKMGTQRPVQAMAIINGPCWTNFYLQKSKKRILSNLLSSNAHITERRPYSRLSHVNRPFFGQKRHLGVIIYI